jgi:beta-galactosidase
MHWFEHNKALDRVGWSTYRDVNHYHWTISQFDRTRAEKRVQSSEVRIQGSGGGAAPTAPYRPYWLLETAPSWSAGGKMWNIHHDGRGIRAYSWYSVLMGGSMVLYWQWRQHWAGQEMQHGTLVTATGRWRPNREAIAQVGEEFARHGRWLLDHPPAPAKLALVLSNEAAWAFSIDPIDEDMRYEVRWRDDYHLPLARAHLWRDVIDETADFAPYRVIIMPLMPMVRAQTRAKLRAWVEAGGLLLLGPLTGYRTEDFTCFGGREFGGLEELMGGESSISFTVHWVEDRTKVTFADGRSCATKNWCEGFAPATARALAHYRGGYGDGHVAAMENALGKGRVITLGCRVSEEVYLWLARSLCDAAGIEPTAGGSGQVIVAPRAGADGRIAGWGVVNLSESGQSVTLPEAGVDLLTGQRVGRELALEALEVMIVEAAKVEL